MKWTRGVTGPVSRMTAFRSGFNLWPNPGFEYFYRPPEPLMGNKIKTEADRVATPRPPAPVGVAYTAGRGQKVSLERGSHTRSKKNPGKRAKKGG
ncbi:hypothetical protein C7444_11646 [Sphaerotilus hippei]|uniref:Uncharacterized protein n=2 Tax=Sphaerotilus hippei TaxID=744406 RepID=A0A318H4L0_9BURK|nr:hypothetical protein C7444_11646 [Sphaerotilus hippei]